MIEEKEVEEEVIIEKSESVKSSKINSNALPFYPSSYVPPAQSFNTPTAPPSSGVGAGTSRPNLFLYSPTSNTMIPCEEIIIPNAVVPGTDVYQGPSNIYLAYPMEQGVASTPSPTSSNCTPPQAQSPPQAGHPASIVQYDQYGVPYTAYTSAPPGVGTSQQPNSSPLPGQLPPVSMPVSSEQSSGESSPPDLSVYHPQNWVPDAQYLANYQQYYQYYPYYYRNTNGYNQYFHHIESSNVPSSAGDSQNEDRSEGEETTPTTATTTTSNSPKKEAKSEAANEKVIIPGLNLKNPRPTKKRRKKKAGTGLGHGLLTSSPSIEHHRGSSSSEANEKNVLKAITILQRTEASNAASAAAAAASMASTEQPQKEMEKPSVIQSPNENEIEEIEAAASTPVEAAASTPVKADEEIEVITEAEAKVQESPETNAEINVKELEDEFEEEVLVVVEDAKEEMTQEVIEQHTEV